MDKLLVVTDYYNEKLESKLVSFKLNSELTVLPLGISPLYFQDNYQITTFSDDDLEVYKEEALSYFVSFPWTIQKSDKVFEKYREKYWFLSHTEKNIWFSKVPHFLFYLKMYLAAKKDFKEIVYLLKDEELEQLLIQTKPRNFIKDYVNFIKSTCTEMLKFVWKFFIIRLYLRKNKDLFRSSSSSLMISMYPEWFKIDSRGNCKDPFFMDMIQPSFGEKWTVGLISYHWRNLFFALKNDKNKIKEKRIFLIDQYNTIMDFFSVFNPISLFLLFRDLVQIHNWKNKFLFSGRDVTNLIQNAVKESYLNGSYYSNLFLNRAFKRLPWDKIGLCLYRLEFQPFENTFLKIGSKTKYLGFQHSVFSSQFTNYVFPHGIFKSEQLLPLPDLLFATGKAVKESFQEAGIEENKIKLVGALRFNKLFEYEGSIDKKELRHDLGIDQNKFVIFMPISPILNENQVLLREVRKALAEFKFEIKILLKMNPNRLHHHFFIEAIKNELASMPSNVAAHLLLEESRYYEMMSASDVLILSGGTAGLEALLLNRPSIIFDSKNLLSHNPMAEFPRVFAVAYDYQDIVRSISLIKSDDFKIDEVEKLEMMNHFFDNKTVESKILFQEMLNKQMG